MSIIDISSASKTVTETVRDQYESYPYPRRDPAEEKERIIRTLVDELGAVNHYCFNGKKDFQNAKILIAGGGTGDATVHLAYQLRNTNAEIVHLDLSQASIDIAFQRAKVHGLEGRIQWLKGSLLELPNSELGPFDLISCTGVLHHLEDPTQGLAALSSVLKPEGAMALMVYGKYGRTGVYHIQELMQMINQTEQQSQTKVDRTRKVLNSLPPTNWYKRGSDLFNSAESMHDTEMYDLLLHSTDRAYSMPELTEFLDRENLVLTEITSPYRALFKPEIAFQDPEILFQIKQLSRNEQLAACELFWGTVCRHEFWASKHPTPVANFDDLENVPFFGTMATRVAADKIQESILASNDNRWSMQLTQPQGLVVEIIFNRSTLRFIELLDGERTTGEIYEQILQESDTTDSSEELHKMCRKVFNALLLHDLILLRHRSVQLPKE